MAGKRVQGAELLTHFVPDLGRLPASDPYQVILATGIWLPLDAYAAWPVMLPWSVRDLSCRSGGGVRAELWSSPDERGYCLDDNSFIKGTARSLPVTAAPGHPLAGARMAGGFTAAHIWREVGQQTLASRIPLLYSFLPNLVWLPTEVAKLTDYEGGPYQRAAQELSVALYRSAPVAPAVAGIAEEAWRMIGAISLPTTKAAAAVEAAGVNWFTATKAFYRTRRRRVDEVTAALETLGRGGTLRTKVVSSRYTSGLPEVSPSARADLLAWLERFRGPAAG